MIDYTKITEEVEASDFHHIIKSINKDVNIRFWLDHEYTIYSEDGKPQLKADVLKKYNGWLFSVTMGISQEFMNDVDINLDEFFISELELHYKRRDKTKDPK